MEYRLTIVALCICSIQYSIQSNKTPTWLSNKAWKYRFAKLVSPTVKLPKRENQKTEFLINNKTLSLNLSPFERDVLPSNIPVYILKKNTSAVLGHSYAKVDKEDIKIDGSYFEDFENKAVLFATYVDHNTTLYVSIYTKTRIIPEGVIGEGRNMTVIYPIPPYLRNPNVTGDNDHVIIYEIGENGFQLLKTHDEPYKVYKKSGIQLNTLYPKFLVVLEPFYVRVLDRSIADTVKYLKIFWNMVHFKYRELYEKDIKVALTVTGIIICEDDDAIDIIKYEENTHRLNFSHLLKAGQEYFSFDFDKVEHFNKFDSIAVMSLPNMTKIRGCTYIDQICEKDIIYVTDNTTFGGFLTAVHEIGHTLGMEHDTGLVRRRPNYSTVLHPDSEKRQFDRFLWTEYSVNQLKEFAGSIHATCLAEDPLKQMT